MFAKARSCARFGLGMTVVWDRIFHILRADYHFASRRIRPLELVLLGAFRQNSFEQPCPPLGDGAPGELGGVCLSRDGP